MDPRAQAWLNRGAVIAETGDASVVMVKIYAVWGELSTWFDFAAVVACQASAVFAAGCTNVCAPRV